MLFLVTMTHTPDNCPAYWPPEKQAELYEGADKIVEAAKELNIKVHFMLAEAGHVMYALLEADNIIAVSDFVNGVPLKQDVKVTPVAPLQDVIAAAKTQMAKK